MTPCSSSGPGSTRQPWPAWAARALHAQESGQLRALLDTPAPYVAGIAASVADNPDDLARIAAAGRVVYLRASPRTLARRVGRGQGRPWLDGNLLTILT